MGLAVILWFLLALGLALLLALALPVRLRLHARSQPVRRLRLELGLLAGMGPSIAMVDTSRRAKPPKAAKKPEPVRRRKRKKARTVGIGAGRGLRMARAAPGLLGGVLRQVRVERFIVDCVFGLGDPAETGQVFGLLAPFQYGSQWAWGRATRVVFTPDFDRRCLEGEADVALAVTPLRLLSPALRFAWAVFGPRR